MEELNQYSAMIGFVLPAILGALFHWLKPADPIKYFVAVLVSMLIALIILRVDGMPMDLGSVSNAFIYVFGFSQLSFKTFKTFKTFQNMNKENQV